MMKQHNTHTHLKGFYLNKFSGVWTTLFRGKFFQIPRASLPNSAAR